MNAEIGNWGDVFDTSIIGIHQVLLADGTVLFWGGDGSGNAFSNTQKYGIYDPATGEHEILEAEHVVRMFCSAGVILPGTDEVLIAGGNGTGAAGGQIFDVSEQELTRDFADDMSTGRFYPTMLSLSSGQAVILGGNGGDGRSTPEIFTQGEGWRTLDGARDEDVGTNWWYPQAWVGQTGEIFYVAIKGGGGIENGTPGEAGSFEIMALDPSGDGSLRQVGEVPFQLDVVSPSAMYDIGKIVIMDHEGNLWFMDINGPTPTFTFAADLGGDRDNSDMTVLPDGRVLINGGTKEGNSQSEADALFQSVIFDPYTGEVSDVDAESELRLYHSSTILLNDGTLLSMGGGGLASTIDVMNAQVYTPDYLYNDDGSLADRLEITAAPESTQPGESLIIEMDDTSELARMSFVKTGAVTHSRNMESGRMDLEFKVLDGQRVEVQLPEDPHVVAAGNWMLFAIDDQGVPSVAPTITVMPTLEEYDGSSAAGGLTAEYFTIGTSVDSLDQIDFNGTVIHTEELSAINIATSGAYYEGGPADDFAVKYTGEFLATSAGSYTFYMTSDDGSRLFIDGAEVIDNDGVFAATEKTVTLELAAGSHQLEMHYFENGGPGSVDLDWSGPSFERSQMQFENDDDLANLGSVTAEYFAIDRFALSLDEINFNAPAIHSETLNEINETSDDAFYIGGPTDDFAVKYSGDVTVSSNGAYTFYMTTDDGARLFINGEQVIDNDGTFAATEKSVTVDLPVGRHEIEMLYFEAGGRSHVDLDWSGPGFVREQLQFDSAANDLITAEYLAIGGAISSLDQINFDDPVIHTELLTEINESSTGAYYEGGPADDFAVKYSGKFMVETGGSYTFYMTSDDGSRLFIDGKEVIDNDGVFAATQKTVDINLTPGAHEIELLYFESGGRGSVDLDWSGPGFARQQMQFGQSEPEGTLAFDIQNQTQFLDGVADDDTFVIDGNSSNYGWGPTEDGTGTVVWGPTGHDILTGFESIQFNDQSVSIADPADQFVDVAGSTQFVQGTDAEETFTINGQASDYGWGDTLDGKGIVVWGPTGHDLLYGVENIQFNDALIELQTPANVGRTVKDELGETQYLFGGEGEDTFVIGDESSNFGWASTGEPNGVVVWNTTTLDHDILYDFDQIDFEDTSVEIDGI